MREKQRKTVITFSNTSEAMALEAACGRENIPGRLIPVPRVISSGCGLSWSMAEGWRERMEAFMTKEGLSWEGCREYYI